ncbi:SURF1 family protein [Microbacterium sp.]|uniref:SURF1 family cytochrome oxidase biogenesis protein n=1 Tax=Microbacterium sp. TaxID=51671 RepID=UPI0025FC87F2|nr:SURF1 family protein [Microbacterium sp.]
MNGRTALRWTGYLAFAVAFAVACAFLANWQFSRNQWREGQLELIAANYDAEPVPLAEVLPVGGSFQPDDEWHPITLEGHYLTEQTLLARNRAHGGTSAFEVLVPFQTDDGRVFIVDRGWVPPAADSPDPEAVPSPPSGQVTVTVRLRPGEMLPPSGRSAPAGQVPTINLPLIGETIGADDIIDGAYGVLVSEDPAVSPVPQAFDSPSEDPGPYLSYAIQWILFALMGFAFIWYIIRTEIQHSREDAEEAAGGESAASVRRRRAHDRRDRDMQEEDSLVDELMPR